jgi:hypothetical protein
MAVGWSYTNASFFPFLRSHIISKSPDAQRIICSEQNNIIKLPINNDNKYGIMPNI